MKARRFGKYKVKYINKGEKMSKHDIRKSGIGEITENFKYFWV